MGKCQELENELQSTALPLLEKADIALDMLDARLILESEVSKSSSGSMQVGIAAASLQEAHMAHNDGL